MVRLSRTWVGGYLLLGCGTSTPEPQEQKPQDDWLLGEAIPSTEQRSGDAELGREHLFTKPLNGENCGIPYLAAKLLSTDPTEKLADRPGDTALIYSFTRFTHQNGADLVQRNCFGCHASKFRGELVLGLGDSLGDYTDNETLLTNLESAASFATTAEEEAATMLHLARVADLPKFNMLTRGTNPAENINSALLAHRDPKTLAWSDTPPIEIATEIYPMDVPPLWRIKKKNALYSTGFGRGDHARNLMKPTALCVETVEEAKEVDKFFPDIRAYLMSLEPPKFPNPIDEARASAGRDIFGSLCAGCHGTYGDNPTYPNLVIPADVVGTDPAMAGGGPLTQELVEWHEESFYGENAPSVPSNGYMPPPLDGIWATGPFLHNGSVPTIEAVLNSTIRPTYWSRSFDENDYDLDNLGWNYTELAAGQDAESDPKKRILIYDTTKRAHGNGGHTYGDDLSDDERAAVIEYLKTL